MKNYISYTLLAQQFWEADNYIEDFKMDDLIFNF